MRKFICIFLVIALLCPLLILSASASSIVEDTSIYEYALFNDGLEDSFFVFKGVEYGFGGYEQFKPATLMLAHSSYLYIIRVPSADLFSISISSDDSGFYLNLPIDSSGVRFSYVTPDSLDPEYVDMLGLTSKLYIPGDLSVVTQSILCNTVSIPWASDSGQSGQFLPSRPVIYSRPLLDPDSVYRIGWESDPFSDPEFYYKRFTFDDINGFFPDSALLYTGQSILCVFQSADQLGSFSVLSSDRVGTTVDGEVVSWNNRLDVIMRNGTYHLRLNSLSSVSTFPSDHVLSTWNTIFNPITGQVTSISRVSSQSTSSQSVSYYDLGVSSLPDVISCLKCSVVPIYLTSSDGEFTNSVLFYQNPRGNQLSPQYKPIPPLDQVVPDYNVQEDALIQEALNKWEASFDSITTFIDDFLIQFQGSFLFAGAVFDLFAEVPVIKFFLYVSLLLGFVMVLFNLAGSAIRSIAKRSGKE